MSTAAIDWRHYSIIKTDHGLRQLTRKQWALFEALHRRRGWIFGDDALIATVWAGQVPRDQQIQDLRVLVHQLRAALIGSRWSITRHRSRGYELVKIPTARQPPRGQQAENVVAV
jgi:DNA-binding response OmpR family regulator